MPINEALKNAQSNDPLIWLNTEIQIRLKAMRKWNQIALTQDICDRLGENPMDKLRDEIKMIDGIIRALKHKRKLFCED
jgi:hypothetical protein